MDGSAVSRPALRWAVEQARLTGAVVDAVTAWTYPTITAWARTTADPQIDRSARNAPARTVEEVVGPEPPVEIRQRAIRGNAAEVLLEQARGADLLVVGSRGYGGFERALLGSVSRHCVEHAPCPVVVVPTVAGGPIRGGLA
ncbi:universal stress protein [Kitasatospora sp. NPDC127059]|uniref:universal stress protein n=1 Tax=unclassified Kitasatospora TaxID=2633591 RepID=UPI003652A6B9